MKPALLIVTVLMVLGAAVASKVDLEQKLLKMLRELNEKAKRDDENVESTLLDYDLLFWDPSEIDLSQPLDAQRAQEARGEVKEGVVIVDKMLNKMAEALSGFDPESTSLADFIENDLQEIARDTEDLTPLYFKIYSLLVQGAIRGTTNEDRPEPTYDFSGDETKDILYVLKKNYYAEHALMVAYYESEMMLQEAAEGGEITMCWAAYTYLWETTGQIDEGVLARKLSRDVLCMRDNIRVVADRFRLGNMIPGNDGGIVSLDRRGGDGGSGGGQIRPGGPPNSLLSLVYIQVALSHIGDGYYYLCEVMDDQINYLQDDVKKENAFKKLGRSLKHSGISKNQNRYVKKQHSKK